MPDSRSAGIRSDLQLLGGLWPYARPYRMMILVSLVSIPLVSALGLLPPFLIMHGIDVNLLGHPAHPLLARLMTALGLEAPLEHSIRGIQATGLAFAVAVCLEYVSRGLQVYGLQVAGFRTVSALREDLFRHVSHQAASFFDAHPTGSLLTRTTSDIEALAESLSSGVVTILSDGVNLLFISVFMLVLSPELTLVSFAIAPVLIGVVNFFRHRLKETFIQVRKSLSELNGYFQEQLAGVQVVQMFNQEERSYREFKDKAIKNLRASQSSNVFDASLYALMDGMAGLCVAGLLWYGGGQVLQNAISPGLLVAFIEYIQRIFVPIREFSGKFAVLQQTVAASERVFSLRDTRQEISPGSIVLPPAQGSIEFKDVWFGYSREGGDALKGISFSVRPGEVVALVGATGSGKTTIGKVLTRLYDGYRGSILLDGHELRDLTPRSVRSQIGVVQQDVLVFNDTIERNISLGNESISLSSVERAASLVQVDDFIRQLPGGYSFRVAERGANLSGGQAQLLAFARVMAHNPPIVLLDEATASIDSHTEARIQAAIQTILETKTVLVIAHRLSTIQAADCIIVLDKGRVAERGTHEELLSQDGLYARLYKTGFADDHAVSIP